jgi:xanthine dehydrogenase YagS FAD-binding subunit
MERFEYVNATSVTQALEQAGEGRAFKAGGLDLLDRMKEGTLRPSRLVNLRGIAALEGIRDEPEGLAIGPLTTLSRLAEDAVVRQRYPALAAAALGAATPQIRNLATAGGNLLQRPRCWYFRQAEFQCLRKTGSDCFAQDGQNAYHAVFANDVCAMAHPSALAVPLTAYGAVLELTSLRGTRLVPIGEFFVAPSVDATREHQLRDDELVTAIRLPRLHEGTRSAYRKQKERGGSDWPLAEVAVVLRMNDGVVREARIVFGAAAPVPWRAMAAERIVEGQRVNEGVARRAAAAAVAPATPLGRNAWKVPVLEAILRRTILEVAS